MPRIILWAITIVVLIAAAILASGNKPEKTTASDGPTLFTTNNCNTCHSITAVGIDKKSKEGSATSNKAPDLSDVGTRHEADWLTAYLQKTQTKDGKKHMVTFRGDKEQLAELTTWLATLEGKSGKPAGE